ncbi:hypothetical protein EV421DRAFT_2041705 [Armillaria borealis]|uniref:Uncharacterized protein n=1 Tax=Armillaria borealis TaxID=47425 RepID=A0AA39IUB0_9AGAR|nr:hypothetical protein EV421DRAFT_2041705 [Armillaria borealis]
MIATMGSVGNYQSNYAALLEHHYIEFQFAQCFTEGRNKAVISGIVGPHVREIDNLDGACYNPFEADVSELGSTMLNESRVTPACLLYFLIELICLLHVYWTRSRGRYWSLPSLLKHLSGTFWDAFSSSESSSSRRIDVDKVRRVLEGKAVVQIVDVDVEPRKELVRKVLNSCKDTCSVTAILEECMRSLTSGKK